MNSKLIQSAESFVVNYLKDNLPSGTLYHGITHTQEVVDSVKNLIKYEDLKIEEAENVLIAAWFHDTGFVNGVEEHEEASVTQLISFFKDTDFSQDRIETIAGCIRATKMPQNPQNKLEGILCDADLNHIATTEFEMKGKLLRAEWEFLSSRILTDVEWHKMTSDFLKEHRFFTEFAYRNWEGMKAQNMANNEKKLKSAIAKEKELSLKKSKKEKGNKEKSAKADKPEKGIETMYRVTLRNHIKLSDIADTKANILLSVNAIILSLALSNLFPKLDKPDNQYLVIPTLIFVVTAVTSMIFAILSTRPKVTSGTFTKQDVEQKKVNLLFFGNFHKMPLVDFDDALFTLMEDKEYLYKSLNKDLYFLGIVLAKKYKTLRLTYTIFMIGIITSVVAFAIAFYNMNMGM